MYLILLGLGVGVLSGLLGIGGGVVLVPVLTIVFGVKIHHAIGISLAAIIPTACSGLCKHYFANNFNSDDLKMAALIVVGGIGGSVLGAMLASALPAPILKRVFGLLMIVIGLNMLFNFSSTIVAAAQVNIEE